MEPSRDSESRRVDAYLSLLATINNGIEDLLGPASKGLIMGTGVKEGRRLAENLHKTNSLKPAVDLLNKAYEGVWHIELRKHDSTDAYFYEDELGRASFDIIVRDCPVRAAITQKNLKQCGPLCFLSNGYLCGMLEEIMGEKVGMEILHAGPLACKKRMFFRV